jgi:exodeoxyribonuclease VIII
MHLMIDLETLGLDSDCVVTQIGYVGFDPLFPGLNSSGILRPDPNEQMFARKRSVDWSTLKWWMQQSNEARESIIQNSDGPMLDCLEKFVRDIDVLVGWSNIQGVWSHGLTFDVTIMQHLFKQYRLKTPWGYRVPKDTRTLFDLVPKMEWIKPTLAHDAEADAIAQALNVQRAYKILMGGE